MALVGNAVRLGQNPMGTLFNNGAFTAARATWGRRGSIMNFWAGPMTVVSGASIADKSAFPSGYLPPYCWCPPMKPGGMASRYLMVGSGVVTLADLVGGKNAEAALTGSGTVSNAQGLLVIFAAAALLGNGAITTANLDALAHAVSALTGSGTITAASLAAAIQAAAALSGSGQIGTVSLTAKAIALAALSGSGDITNANLKLAAFILASLFGTGVVTADLQAKANAVAALIGSGAISAATLIADGYLDAAVTALGSLVATTLSNGFMFADINVTGDILTTANVGDAVWNEPTATHNDPDTYGGLLKQNIYTAKTWLFDDNTAATDRYVTVWFLNGAPMSSGITSPTIQVVKVSDGSNLIPVSAMTEIASLGRYRYNATGSERIVDGSAYIAFMSATIDGETRNWDQPVGRDS